LRRSREIPGRVRTVRRTVCLASESNTDRVVSDNVFGLDSFTSSSARERARRRSAKKLPNTAWNNRSPSLEEVDEMDALWAESFPQYLTSSAFLADMSEECEDPEKLCLGEGGDEVERAAREEEDTYKTLGWYDGVDSTDDVVWTDIRKVARKLSNREPLLSSFLHTNVLSHQSLEKSVCFILANRLSSPVLLATELMEIFENTLMRNTPGGRRCRMILRMDLNAFRERDPACKDYLCALLYMKGFHALQTHQISHYLWTHGQDLLALALQSRASEVYAVDIHPGAQIGHSILLDHGTGVVIGETARVGNYVSILQGVTLGGTGKATGDRHPKVGDGVLLGASSTVLGNIKIGQGAWIAAGSLVLKSVPVSSIVAGSPARLICKRSDERFPALALNQDPTKVIARKNDLDANQLHLDDDFFNERNAPNQRP